MKLTQLVPSLWLPFGGAPAQRPPPLPERRDDYVFADIAVRLRATGFFDQVTVGAQPAQAPIGADRTTAAWVQRLRGRETPVPPDGAYDRHVTYHLWLAVRGGLDALDFEGRFQRLAQAEAIARNALDGQSLAGFCMWAFTKLGEATEERAHDGETRVRLAGEFRYHLPDGRSGHDPTDPRVF